MCIVSISQDSYLVFIGVMILADAGNIDQSWSLNASEIQVCVTTGTVRPPCGEICGEVCGEVCPRLRNVDLGLIGLGSVRSACPDQM
jgi:hypothetical protein